MSDIVKPAGLFDIEELDSFVHRIDELGGIGSPNMQDYLREFSVNLSNEINFDLDPFSNKYVENNIKFYEN